jgi:tRNA dimethylallyltransferase
MEKKRKLIVIAGPTASGKTATSVALAKRIGGEIISADSMQVYKHMDIGSAKIMPDEMDGVPHHLVDILDPREQFNVNIFQTLAKEAMEGIYQRGHIPILVGGTGFYIQSITRDIDFSETKQDAAVREQVESFYRDNGKEALHEWLKDVDEAAALTIHANNVKRVMRGIEYYLLTGQKISQHNKEQQQKESPYDLTFFVLNMDRELLYQRIDQRVDFMLEAGLVEEVQQLKVLGVIKGMTSMEGLGYKEIMAYLDGDTSLEEAVYILKRDTRHFAKRQLTWFRREKNVTWVNVDEYDFDVNKILEFMVAQIN